MIEENDEQTLTAYALGEMQEPEHAIELAALEQRIAVDESARRHVDQVRATARLLSEQLGEGFAPTLTALQHAEIERRAQRTGHEEDRLDSFAIRPHRRNWAMWGSLAASIVIVCTVMASVLPKIYHIGRGPTGTPAGPGSIGIAPPSLFEAPRYSQSLPLSNPSPDEADGLPFSGAAPPFYKGESTFVGVGDAPVATLPVCSTFPDDAARGSFVNVQRCLMKNQLPPPPAVRTDQIINALPYHYEAPGGADAVAVSVEVGECLWTARHRILRIGVRIPDSVPATLPATAPSFTAPSATDIQIEFNPALATAYRLIGYEDATLAGNEGMHAAMPSGAQTARTITVLYEVVPVAGGSKIPAAGPPHPLRYQMLTQVAGTSGELATVTVHIPGTPAGVHLAGVLEHPVVDDGRTFATTSADFRVVSAAAAFGMLLRHSPNMGGATYDRVVTALEQVTPEAGSGAQSQLLDMARKAKALSGE